MSRRALLVLVGLLVVLGVVAAVGGLGQRQAATPRQALLLPGFKERLNDFDRVVVTAAGDTTVATLVRGKDAWTVQEREYPADLAKLRRNLLALGDATLVEEKTSNPELYGRLGVEDVAGPEARSLGLTISGGEGEPVKLIIGDTGVSGSRMAYVRRAGEAQSWLVNADLDIGRTAADWLDRQIVDVSAARVHAVTITHPGGAVLKLRKDQRGQENFTVLDIPAGRTLNFEGVANGIAAVLSALNLEDVQDRSALGDAPGKPVLARFETFDGLVIEASAWQVPAGTRVTFSASTDEALAKAFAPPGGAAKEPANGPDAGPDAGQDADKGAGKAGAATDGAEGTGDGADDLAAPAVPFPEVQKQAEAINARVAGWVYTIPSFKSEQLTRRVEDITQSR